jgi:D-beta-D-heptose 7-phosphate kinase/D-beta-D-heptose 1-phosphate adenosyltransferase
MKKVVVVSGYFNPIHKGHIELFNKAKSHGGKLWVIVNNDLQRKLKGSNRFMNEDERLLIVSNLKMVDFSIISVDEDRTVSETLRVLYTKSISSDPKQRLIFANGGDQTNESIPESSICNMLNIKMIDGLGDKIQSSSWLINDDK